MWTYDCEHQVYNQFSVLYEQTHAHGWRFVNKKCVLWTRKNLTQQRLDIWVGALCKMPDALQLNLHMNPFKFRQKCQDIVRSKFIQELAADISKHPILRTYRYIKSSFRTEPYLYLVNDKRYRLAISQLRCSSHILNVEKERYTRPELHSMKDCATRATVLTMNYIL